MSSPTLPTRGGLGRGGLSPFEVAKAYREENPRLFDDLDDAELIRAIEHEDPDTFALIDPLLIGAENLAPFTGKAGPPPPKKPTLIPPPPDAGIVIPTALRVVPALAGAGVGTLIAPGGGTMIGGGLGSGLGETAAQWYEQRAGSREEFNIPSILWETGVGAVLPGSRGETALGRTAWQAAYGAGLGTVGGTGRTLIEQGRLPTGQELVEQAALGGAFGAATHGAFEGYRGLREAAPSLPADQLGGFPTEGGPPPRPSPAEQLVLAQAAAAQHQAEEAQLAARLRGVFGPDADRARQGSYHTALEAKDYLDQLAKLNQPPVAVPPVEPVPLWQSPDYIQRAAGLPEQLQLPPGRGDVGPFRAYPPGDERQIELAGALAPPRSRVVGGTDVGYVQPPPTLEDALAASLERPPGPPRLVRPLELTSPPGALEGVPRETDLLPPPRPSFEGPIRQGARMGGRPAALEQPRIPGVETPGAPTGRTYTTGPNAGPRRGGELHGQPRTWRRQLRTGKKLSFEEVPSPLAAEDPGTYPPEVRRELASMAWELEQFPHERHQGGLTRQQITAYADERGIDTSTAIAELRASGASAGGATPGAPVFHDVITAAKGARPHITRAEMLQEIRGALLEGKGTLTSDAAAQVARTRLAMRARGENPMRLRTSSRGVRSKTQAMLAKRGDEGDALIGWVDEQGRQTLPDQHLDEWARAVRDAEDDELRAAVRMLREGEPISEASRPFFDAAIEEAERRGLIERIQEPLRMLGPGAEGGPPMLPLGEERPAAPPSSRRSVEEEGPPPPDRIQKLIASHMGTEQPPPEHGVPLFGQPPEAPPPPHPSTQREPLRTPGEFLPVEQDTGDVPIPGLEKVRMEERLLPEVTRVPEPSFELTPPPEKPGTPAKQGDLFSRAPLLERLFSERGVLILNVPAGDRTGLKRWLQKQEAQHGGEAWYSRVEQAIEDGEWDRAWKVAAAASAKSYAKAVATSRGPEEERILRGAVRGTPMQADLNTQIIAGARQRAGVGEAPPVREFPPSKRATQAGAARGKATLGPAGILSPGPRQRPLSSAAPELRAATLDKEVVKLILEGIAEPEGLATVPGNTDTYLRLFRQVGEQVYKGQNLKLLRDAGVRIPPEELAQHFNATISDAGRTLQLLSQFAQANAEILTEAAERMSMGGALRGMIRGEPGAEGRYVGARGRVLTTAGQKAAQEVVEQVAQRTNTYQATALANDMQKRTAVGPLRALHDASYAWMLSKWNTAVRNYMSFTGRYSIDSLDHALTIPIARLTGDEPTAALSTALLKERGALPFQRGAAVTPKAAWSDELQTIYNFTADSLDQLHPRDVRHGIKLLLDSPTSLAEYLGTMGGEDLSKAMSDVPVLRTLTNTRLGRVLTMFNRAQEFSARGVVFNATTRALLRAKGIDPAILLRPTPEIIQAVGGQQAFEDLIFTSTSQALEASFAGRTAKDSLPGALIRAVNNVWPVKLGVPFPRFNFSAAPRWIYDHSPAAMLDWLRFPMDTLGVTAPKGTQAGGRLYRGVRAQQIQRTELPALQGRMGVAERAQGTALQELLGTQKEWSVRQRQVTRLQKRAQQQLPGTTDALTEALNLRDQLARRRETLKGTIKEQRGVVLDLMSEQKKLLDRVADATAINAPNYAQSLARMSVGVGMLGAAMVIRNQPGAQGTRWYEYRVEREGKDPIVLDFRPVAPFAQYLFVGDVLNDFLRHTNWSAVHDEVLTSEEGVAASPLEWSRSMWNHYEGKYTEGELGAQFAQAFLSISRAAGTTLTLADLATQEGWPSLEEFSRAIVGTIGQFFSRFTVPGQQVSDVAGQFSPEEAKIRTPPRATIEDWERPLAAPLANVPYVRRVIPERISQTTGQPVATEYPLLRALAGIGTTPRDFIVEEVRRVGVPGQSVFIRETGDYALDQAVARSYAQVLKEELPAILRDPSYQELGTPARQRDFLQRSIFPALKRVALAEARQVVPEEAYQGATVRGEEARRRARTQRLIAELEAENPLPEDQAPPDVETPPGRPAATGPPPPPF